MVISASKSVVPLQGRAVRASALLAVAVLSLSAIWLAQVAMRRPYTGKVDPETGGRFTFTLASEWVPAKTPEFGFAEKRDDFVFSLPKPTALQTWFETYLLRRRAYPYTFPFLKNEIGIVSGHQTLSGNRSPFKAFTLQGDYPAPKHPGFTDLPRTTVMEERHLLAAGQPALWRVTRTDLPLNPTLPVPLQRGSYKFYTYMLVVKIKGEDSWLAVEGTGDESHQRQIEKEVRALTDSLRIE